MRSFAFRSVLAAAVAVCFAEPSFAGDVGFDGAWAGQMRQIDTEEQTRYPMELNVKGDRLETRYRTLSCGGVLEKIADHDSYSIYREKITTGAIKPSDTNGCIDGIVTLRPHNGNLIVGWFGVFEGLPTVAYATLERRSSK